MVMRQGPLFTDSLSFPEGFEYREELLSPTEEADLVRQFRHLDFEPFQFRGFLGKRRVAAFGWKYDFNRSRLGEAPPAPDFLLELGAKVATMSYGKSIKRERVEGDFEALLRSIQPTPALFSVAVAMFEKLWNHLAEGAANTAGVLESERSKTRKQIEILLERILTAESALVISTYEKRIQNLEEQILLFEEKIDKCIHPRRSFENSL